MVLMLNRLLCAMVVVLAVTAGGFVMGADDGRRGKPVNTRCPISGKLVSPDALTVYKGETIGFCCGNCVKKFESDPAKHVKKVQRDAKK